MPLLDAPLQYMDQSCPCEGHYYLPGDHQPQDHAGPLPVVLVTPAWDGVVQEVHDKARKLAGSGYIAMVVDVYGEGRTLDDMSEMEGAAGPLMADRSALLRRMKAALAAAKTIPGADTDRIAAMGYCFGGLCVLDLARGGGTELKAAVSFHGALMAPEPASGEQVQAKLLVLHGSDDPMVPAEQVLAFKQEMNAQGVDWQLVEYSNTVHAFTRADANMPEIGAVYNESADRRSWQAMLNFLDDALAT